MLSEQHVLPVFSTLSGKHKTHSYIVTTHYRPSRKAGCKLLQAARATSHAPAAAAAVPACLCFNIHTTSGSLGSQILSGGVFIMDTHSREEQGGERRP